LASPNQMLAPMLELPEQLQFWKKIIGSSMVQKSLLPIQRQI